MDSNTEQAGDPAQLQRTDSDASSDGFDVEVVESDPTGRYSRFSEVLGRGAFKTVYKGFDDEEGTEIAWNQVRVVELVNSKEERDRLFAEIWVLKQLKHKNIMSFHDSWLDNKNYCVNFITELFTSGTLRQYRRRHRHIDFDVMKRWAWQILCGLVYLHGHNPPIIHRDLKCDNIFINGSSGIVKIGDLGLATLLRARTAPQSVLGTPEFMAPELYDEEYDDRVDVYSYGMCLLELATMEYPYSECRNAAQIYKKVTLGVRPQCLAKVTCRELADFIAVCIRPRHERPRSRHLLKHPYFNSIRQKACPKPYTDTNLSATTSQTDMHSSASSAAGSHAASVDGDLAHHPVHVALASVPPSPLPASPLQHTAATSKAMTPEVLSPAALCTPFACDSAARSATAVMNIQAQYRSNLGAASDAADLNADSNQLTPGSLQSAVESLHIIADHLPGLLDGNPERQVYFNEDGTRRSSLRPISSEQEAANSRAYPDREFRVRGKLIPSEQHSDDSEKLNLRLRIIEPDGPAKTVQFDFDLGTDTAMSVASEMVDDLCLSAEDARSIAAAIREEILLLTGIMSRRQHSASSSDAGVDQIDVNEKRSSLEESISRLQDHHQHMALDAETGGSPSGRQQRQAMPPEPGDCTVVRLSSFTKPRSRWDLHQPKALPSVAPGINHSSQLNEVESKLAAARDECHALDGFNAAASGAVQSHHTSISYAASAPLRCGSSALQPQSLPEYNRKGGVDGSAYLPYFDGQEHIGRQLHASAETSPTRSISVMSEDGYAGSAMSVDVSTGSVGGTGRENFRSLSSTQAALPQEALTHLDKALSDSDVLPHGLVHSGSTQTLKGSSSADLSSQLAGAVLGVKRSGSGVVSPARIADRDRDRKVPLHQLFTDVGHIPRLQPIARPLRITDLAVAPAACLPSARIERAAVGSTSGFHSRSSTADSLPAMTVARRTATAPAIPTASVIGLPPVPAEGQHPVAAVNPSSGDISKQPPQVQGDSLFSPRGTVSSPAAPHFNGGCQGGGGSPARVGNESAMTHYGGRGNSDFHRRHPGCTLGAHSTASVHDNDAVYSRRSLVDSATSLPACRGWVSKLPC